MESDLLDKILERSVMQYRTALFEARDGIRADIHKAGALAQNEDKTAVRVRISHGLTISVHDSMVIDTISHGVKDRLRAESSWVDPHPELPFGEDDGDS